MRHVESNFGALKQKPDAMTPVIEPRSAKTGGEASEEEMALSWTRTSARGKPLRPQFILVRSEDDILRARECARQLAIWAGFSVTDSVLLTACVSEIAREMLRQESTGAIRLMVQRGCLRIEADFRARSSGDSIKPEWWFSLKRCLDEFRIEVVAEKSRRLVAVKYAFSGHPQ